jgi:hypothetical protein
MNKATYTKLFLSQLGKAYTKETIAEYLPLWWQNTREKEEGGLRLTDAGFQLFTELEIESYEIVFPKDMPFNTQTIIFLDKFINCPYYLTKKSIFVTDEKKAVELTLFSGDVRRYGIIKALSKAKKDKNSD